MFARFNLFKMMVSLVLKTLSEREIHFLHFGAGTGVELHKHTIDKEQVLLSVSSYL